MWKHLITKRRLLLCFVLLIGAFLRFQGIKWGLPTSEHNYCYHPDEIIIVRSIYTMGQSDLNPHYFINPSLYPSIIGSVLWILRIFNAAPALTDAMHMSDLSALVLIGRFFTAMIGLGSVFLLYRLAKTFYDEKTAMIAAVLFSVIPLHAVHSHYLTVEVPSTFFILLAFLAFSYLVATGRRKYYIYGGIATGLAATTKYTGGLCVFMFLIAHFFASGKKAETSHLWNKNVVTYFICTGVAFAFGTPYALLSPHEFISSLFRLVQINVHAAEARFPVFSLFWFTVGPPLFAVSIAGILIGAIKRTYADILILAWLALNILLIIISGTPFTRHLVLISPFLALTAARAFGHVLLLGSRKRWVLASLAVAFSVVIGSAGFMSVAYVNLMSQTDVRDRAVHWINGNIPVGSQIGVAKPWFYTPSANLRQLTLTRTGFSSRSLLSEKPDYFIITDFEYREAAYIRRFFAEDYADSNRFLEILNNLNYYQLEKTFEVTPNFCGISFSKGFPPHDWMYVYPTIRIYKRT
jgi:hypothetical protein